MTLFPAASIRAAKTGLLCLLLLSTLDSEPTMALEIRPYENSQISADEWKQYYTKVSRKLRKSKKPLPDAKLEMYFDEKSFAYIMFTLEEHPAHPAWVTRFAEVDKETGAVVFKQLGFYAGEEAMFATLFDEVSRITDSVHAEIPEEEQKPMTADESKESEHKSTGAPP
jgi:hypothetical protein